MEQPYIDDAVTMRSDKPNAGDEALIVKFFLKAVQDKAATTEAGRPIFRDVEYIQIRQAGNKLEVFEQPVRASDDYRTRFAAQYAKFKAGKSGEMTGTLLSEWPPMPRSLVEELAFFNIHTVEQLAAVPDGNIPNVGPISVLKQRAKDFLTAAKEAAPGLQMRAEIEASRAERDELKRQLAAQADLIAKLASRDENKPSTEATNQKGKRP